MKEIAYNLSYREKLLIFYDEESYLPFTGKIIAENFTILVKNGVRHCEDGPAVIYKNGNKEYYFYGTKMNLSEKDFLLFIRKQKLSSFK